jgi:hypothetical protein
MSKQYALLLFLNDPEEGWYSQVLMAGVGTSKPEDPIKNRNIIIDHFGADIAYRAIDRLGWDDTELTLVSYNINTGSITILYHPDHNTNKAFYDNKLSLLVGE